MKGTIWMVVRERTLGNVEAATYKSEIEARAAMFAASRDFDLLYESMAVIEFNVATRKAKVVDTWEKADADA